MVCFSACDCMNLQTTSWDFNVIIELFLTLSDLVLVGCSNKTLHIYDMNVGKCVRVFSDVHVRQPHIITQNKVG